MAEAADERVARRNMWLIGADYVGFALGMAFLGPTTLLATFVHLLGGSAVLVGSLSTIQSGGWLLPQILAGRLVADRPLVMRYILIPAYAGRMALLLAVPAVALLAQRYPGQALAALLFCYVCFVLGDSISSVPWFDLLGKVVSLDRRGRFFGLTQVAGGLLAVGAGLWAKAILNRPGSQLSGHLLLMVLATLCFLAGTTATAVVREPRGEVQHTEAPTWGAYLPRLMAIMRTDPRFVWLVAVRWFSGLADVATAFYTLFALQRLHAPESMVGIFVSAMVGGGLLSGVVLGHVADRSGPARVIGAMMALRSLAIALALLAPVAGGAALVAMLLAFTLTGMANGCYMVGLSNYCLAIAPPAERATYVALGNTLGGLVALAPLAGGFLVEACSFEALFTLALVCALVGSALALRQPQATAMDALGHGT
ncbi:MAG: MFS transporter [Anaerolineae bacterium]